MRPPSRRISEVRRSGIREIMEVASEYSDVLHLEVGEPDFSTPEHVLHAAAQAGHDGHTRYTSNKGFLEVRQAVAKKLEHFNHLRCSPEQLVVTTGAVTGIMETLLALVDPDEAIFLPDPGWPNYEMMASLLGAQVVRYPLSPTEDFRPDLEHLDYLVRHTERPKAIVINSPGNPTGAVFPLETMNRLVEITARHGLYLVSDECYEAIVFDGEHVSPATLDEEGRVISVFSLSKTYAMTGWRVGYVAASQPLADHIAKVQEAVISCATSVAQQAAKAALEGDQTCVHTMRAAYRERRDLAVQLLDAAGLLVVRPSGAFYVMADISATGLDSYDFARRLISEYNVAVAPGETFGPGGAGMIRISLAADPQSLTTGIERFIKAEAAHAEGSRV